MSLAPEPVDIGRVTRNSVYLSASGVPLQAINAFYFVFLARSLMPHRFGEYVAIWALVSIAAAVIEQGLARFITREIAREPGRASIQLSGGIALSAILAATAAAGMTVVAAATGYSTEVELAAMLAGLSLVPRGVWTVLTAALNAQQQMGYAAVLSLAATALTACFGVAAVAAGGGLALIFIAAIAGQTLTAGLALQAARRAGLATSLRVLQPGALRRTWCGGLAFNVRALAGITYFRADVLMLTAIVGFSAAGIYQSAYKIFELAILVPGAVNLALYPVFSQLHGADPGRLKTLAVRQAAYLLGLGLPVAVVLVAIPGTLVSVVFGGHYGAAAGILRLLAPAVLVAYTSAPFISVVTSSDLQREATTRTLVALAANVALNALLIPTMHGQGAAIAMIASELVVLGTMFPLARRLADADYRRSRAEP